MREILFRGRTTQGKEWVSGYYAKYSEGHFIGAHNSYGTMLWFEVDPETVGQFTGWVFNGVKAFQGDIVKSAFGIGVIRFGKYRVELDLGDCEIDDHAETWIDSIGFYIEYTSGEQTVPDYDWMDYFTVIGNIHDNPELLEV